MTFIFEFVVLADLVLIVITLACIGLDLRKLIKIMEAKNDKS